MTSLRQKSWSDGGHLILGVFVNVCFLAVLVLFAYLREHPSFWTNAGDWPIWLRELVGDSFYPLLLLELFLLVIFSAACVRFLISGDRTNAPAILALPFLWTFFTLVLLIAWANNLDNLIAGRPLHWHSP